MGAVGGIIANIALTPLTAGASLLQSYWYGSGLILGERMMYTVHWEKIKARLDKGETFMNVLDAEMNKDITAIAELSFKAMEDTGNLFLTKAGTTVSKFIEELLSAAIDPFFSGTRTNEEEPPPEEPPGEEIIHYNIDKVNSLDIHQIRQILAFPERYTETTVALAKVRLVQLELEQTEEDTVNQEITDLKYDLLLTETLFLQELFTFVPQPPTIVTSIHIQKVYSDFITKMSSGDQSATINHLASLNINGIFTIRNSSTESDATLVNLRSRLTSLRTNLKFSTSQTSINNFQREINYRHVGIALWQMIYSR